MHQWKIPLRKFSSALWDKKFSTENLGTPPSSLLQTFSVPEINATMKDSPTEIFVGTVRQKIFDGKSWYSPPLLQTFSLPENNATVKDSPTEIFGTVRQKIFDEKSWYPPPPPPPIHTFSIPEINATVKDSPTEICCTMRQKIFDVKSWYPPLLQTFSIPEISETLKGYPTNFSAHWDQNNFNGITWYPPSVIFKLFSIRETFWNTEGTHYEVFRSCETKKFRQIIVASPLLCMKIFDTRVFSKDRFFAPVRQKN